MLRLEYERHGYTAHIEMFNSKYWNVPQNRDRYAVVGTRNKKNLSFTFPKEQHEFVPKLSDYLEKDVPEKYYLPDEKAQTIIAQAMEKLEKMGKCHACITPDRINKRQNNATEEVKEQFEKGNMKITSAYETSRLSEDAQKEVAAAVEAGADIKSEEIKQMSEEKKKKRKTAEDIAKEQNVSDTDTSEEEKANAKKLHAVKMLEKYYIYLSEEETGILERMLEDCKRRKREYALEED